MLVFAAFTPHTPLLLPTIAKQQQKALGATTQAMKELAEELYAVHPETVLILSGHGAQFPDAFSINLHDHYRTDLTEFGDMATTREFFPDLEIIDRLQKYARNASLPFTLYSDPVLDYGTAVPLLLLTEHLLHISIVPVSYSAFPAKNHFEFGRLLKEVVIPSEKRIAVIASGDLSHALSSDAPAGFHPEGPIFDACVRDIVQTMTPSRLLQMVPKDVERAHECGYRPLLILMGLLEGMHMRPHEYVYDAPFGVGYLVAHFE